MRHEKVRPICHSRRWPRLLAWGLVPLLLLGILAGLSGYAHHLAAPHPERFASGVITEGTALEAMAARPLAQQYLRDFHTQHYGSSCGPASLRNVLGSLERPVASEDLLFHNDRSGWLRMRIMGMTLDALADLTDRSGIGRVQVHRDLSQEAFRELLRTLDRPGRRLILNYNRAPINGVSLGHFSPIGGYDSVRDQVLVLDVTPGYGIQLVPTTLLHAAMQTRDSVSGQLRGLIQIDAETDHGANE